MTSPVPNLCIIGAQKSGTTSLHAALDLHPDIFMSTPVKEPTYFLPEGVMLRYMRPYKDINPSSREDLLRDYMLAGYAGQRYFGEASTSYTLGDRAKEHRVPTLMKARSPDIRLIYIVRNPFARIASAHAHNVYRRKIGTVASLAQGDDPVLQGFLTTSLYHYQIAQYLEVFPRDRIHVLGFEDFVTAQEESVNAVLGFLGLPAMELPERICRNAARAPSPDQGPKFPRVWLARIHDAVVDDARRFGDAMDFDVSRWDLDFEAWCAD